MSIIKNLKIIEGRLEKISGWYDGIKSFQEVIGKDVMETLRYFYTSIKYRKNIRVREKTTGKVGIVKESPSLIGALGEIFKDGGADFSTDAFEEYADTIRMLGVKWEGDDDWTYSYINELEPIENNNI